MSEHAAELRGIVPPGAQWSAVRADPALIRAWRAIKEEPTSVLLQHGTGTVAEIRLEGDTVKHVAVRDGDDASRLQQPHQVDAGLAMKARAALRRGRPVDDAVAEVWPRMRGLREIPGAPTRKRWYQLARGGVLEVEVAAGVLIAYRFLQGGDALDALATAEEARHWDVPAGASVTVRTPAEARLYLAVNRAEWEHSRTRDGALEVLGRTADGLRRYTFQVQGPGARPGDMGPGKSACLDPAQLVGFATRVEGELPDPAGLAADRKAAHAALLRLAAEGLRQATRFARPGKDLPPIDGYASRSGEYLRLMQPELFKTARLNAEATRLDALAAEWEPPPPR